MQGIIKGFAMFHSGQWFKDTDPEKKDPQNYYSLFVMDRGDSGPVMHKVKVPSELAGQASSCDEKVVELIVDIKQTNFQGKSGTEFKLLKLKAAA